MVLGKSKQEDSHQPEKPLEKRGKLITKLEYQRKPKMKRKFNKFQKRITP